MWNRLTQVTRGQQPLALNEIKAQCRVDGSRENPLLIQAADAAQAMIEGPNGKGVAIASGTWRLSLDRFDCEICIPLAPVTAITSVTYVDGSGVVQTLDPTKYQVDLDATPCVIRPAYGLTFPTTRSQLGAVKVTFVAGYTRLPADLRQAMLMLVSHLYQNREAQELPKGVSAILDRYAVAGF